MNACDKLPKILNALVIKCAPGMVGELISDTYKRWSQKQKNHT